MVLGAPRSSKPLAPSEKRGGAIQIEVKSGKAQWEDPGVDLDEEW